VHRKFEEFIPEAIMPQFLESKLFPPAIAQYIEQTELSRMNGDALVLLSHIFSCSSFIALVSDRLVQKLIQVLEFVENPQIFDSIIYMLIAISNEWKNMESEIPNPVIENCKAGGNGRFIEEVLLKFLNSAALECRIKCVYFLMDILNEMQKVSEFNFFYSNDFEELVNIILRDIKNGIADPQCRLLYFQLMEKLMLSKDYRKGLYKFDEVGNTFAQFIDHTEIMEDQATRESVIALLNAFERVREEEGVELELGKGEEEGEEGEEEEGDEEDEEEKD
jgi:hypothetical protein